MTLTREMLKRIWERNPNRYGDRYWYPNKPSTLRGHKFFENLKPSPKHKTGEQLACELLWAMFPDGPTTKI